MITEIIDSAGGISANWFFGGMGALLVSLAVYYLNRHEKRMEKMERRYELITRIQLQMLTKLGIDDEYYAELCNQLNVKD